MKTFESTESIIRPKKGGVGISDDGDGNDNDDGGDDGGGCISDFDMKFHLRFYTIAAPLTSIIKTSLSTDSSTSATKIAVKHDEVDGGGGKLVKKVVKKSKNCQKAKNLKRFDKSAKVIGSEERLPKHQFAGNWI